jgi:hypothetical protein
MRLKFNLVPYSYLKFTHWYCLAYLQFLFFIY